MRRTHPFQIALFLSLISLVVHGTRADEPATASRPAVAVKSRAEKPPRKVIVGTVILRPPGAAQGTDERLQVLGRLIDDMARQATEEHPKRGLDLAILPETTVTPSTGSASQRAMPLRGKVEDTFSELARRHTTYILVPLDLAETSPRGTTYSNSAVLFDRGGRVAGIYRKVHPVALVGSRELEGGITPGADYPVFECDFGRLGVQICWDIQFDEGWEALAQKGAEIVAWPTASPATAQPAARAGRHRYYIVSSTWRDNATIFEPTGLVAAQIRDAGKVLVRELDLSYAILGWSSFLKNGEALREKFGDKVGYHYEPGEDLGLFWSHDPSMTIGEMIRSIGGEEIDAQVDRNRQLQDAARRRAEGVPGR
jgi:predicted amidohydrolase